jgi:hypothetical protein
VYEFALEFFWVAKNGENLPQKKKEHYYVLLTCTPSFGINRFEVRNLGFDSLIKSKNS